MTGIATLSFFHVPLRQVRESYATATLDTLQYCFLHASGLITNHDSDITVCLDRRAYSPVLRQANIPPTTVPWWGNWTLPFQYS